jgi:hypothetical protein
MGVNTVYYNEAITVLNNDGKIQLCAGIPFPKLGQYTKTQKLGTGESITMSV